MQIDGSPQECREEESRNQRCRYLEVTVGGVQEGKIQPIYQRPGTVVQTGRYATASKKHRRMVAPTVTHGNLGTTETD